MAVQGNPRKLIPLAAVLCLLVAAAFGGYAVAGSRAPETVNLTGASATSGHAMTVYACLASGKLTHVSVAAAPACPAGAVPVQWAAQRALPSPSPSISSPSSPSPSISSPGSSSPPPSAASSPPSNPSPSSPGSGTPCVTSGLAGTCGPYADPDITAADGFNTDIANNMWGCGPVQPPAAGAFCGVQTLTSHGPGNWSVTSDQKAGNTGVLSYPDVAYDIWVDSGSNTEEIMIWVDNHGQTPAGDDKGSVVIGGTTYELWSADGTVSFVRSNEQSGTVDILAVLHWLQSNGYIGSTADLGQVDFGWEICSTGGVPETFTVSNYTLKDTCSSACSG
jgi:hypothetical protein